METYTVYKAEYDGYVYYGYTKNLKKRRQQMIRNYSIVNRRSMANYSNDALSRKAKQIDVSPKKWKYTVLEDGLSKEYAIELRWILVNNDARCINVRCKRRG